MASKKTGTDELNLQQIAFCKAYVTEEFFCNGTKAYGKAHPDAEYSTCKSEASKYLTNPNILNYIDSLIENMGLNDQRADKELAKMMIQDEDKAAKMKALDMFYKISARVERGLSKALKNGDVEKDVLPSINITSGKAKIIE